jgi:hypothetical protein
MAQTIIFGILRRAMPGQYWVSHDQILRRE